MNQEQHDYYSVLGLPQTADREAIKKAFRGLAQEYHPDVSDAPDAERRFREIVEAYEALTRPLERGVGSRAGRAWPAGRRSRARDRRKPRTSVELTIPYLEAVRGIVREVEFAVEDTCRTCRGEGMAPGAVTAVCSSCDGDGWVRTVSRSTAGRWIQVEACGECAGAGVVFSDPCSRCNGSGRVERTRVVPVAIPAGVRDGTRIHVPGVAGDAAGHLGEASVVIHVERPPDPMLVRVFATVGVLLALVLLVVMVRSL